MIRFQRIGRTNDPAFRIVVLEKQRAAQAGNITDRVGTYNPKTKAITLDIERVKEWLAKGAQPTDTVRNLLIAQGVLDGKKVNALPKKTPLKKDEPEAPAAEAVEAPATAEEAPAEAAPADNPSTDAPAPEEPKAEEAAPAEAAAE